MSGPAAWVVAAAALAAALLVALRRWYPLAGAPQRPRAPGPALAAALTGAMLLAGALGAALVVQVFWRLPDFPPLEDLDLKGHAQLLLGRDGGRLLVAIVFLAARSAVAPPVPDRRAGRIRAALLGAAAIVLLWPALQTLAMTAAWADQRLTGDRPDAVAHETLRLLIEAERGGWLLLLVGLVTLAGPVFEEILYRGLVQHGLVEAGLPRAAAIVAASGLFAFTHVGAVEPYALPSLFVLSLGFGWAYERTGRLTAPITMHVLFNLGNLLLAFLSVEESS